MSLFGTKMSLLGTKMSLFNVAFGKLAGQKSDIPKATFSKLSLLGMSLLRRGKSDILHSAV